MRPRRHEINHTPQRSVPFRVLKRQYSPTASAAPGWKIARGFAAMAVAVLVLTGGARQAIADDSANLAKQLNNPVANLISFPIQSNFDFNVGPSDGWRNTNNVQSVLPFSLNEDWNVISRTVLPVIYQNDVAGKSGSQFGLGDTVQSLFFSPQAPLPTPLGNLIWGAGPAAAVPTSTDRLLGLGTFGLGPTGVVLFQEGPWTYGALVNHIWGVAKTRDNVPDLNNTFMQPFIAYTTPTAWTYSLNAELNYNWEADGGEKLSGPINFGVSKLVNIGKQPVSFQGRLRWWAADTPASAEGLGFTFNVTFLFPK